MHDWKRVTVSPSDSIRETLKKIDNEALRIAVVIDNDYNLLGVVTDGDVRRGLIKGIGLADSVSKVMNSSPRHAGVETSVEEVELLMKSHSLLAIPILEGSKVVGLHTFDSISSVPNYENPVFIMAGGFGTRLRPLTDNCPKPLLNVGNKPILETVIKQFVSSGFHNFYISTHFLSQMIRDYFGDGSQWNININYVHENEPLGTGGALGLLPDDIKDKPVIVMNGDVLTSIDIKKVLAYHTKKRGIATMCVREYEYQVPFGVVETNDAKLSGMIEKPTYRYSVNAGIYILEQQLIRSVEKNVYIDMPTLLENRMNQGVYTYTFHDYWLDIGRMEDFNKAQTDIKILGLCDD